MDAIERLTLRWPGRLAALILLGLTVALAVRRWRVDRSRGRALGALSLGLGLAAETRSAVALATLFVLVVRGATFVEVKLIEAPRVGWLLVLAWAAWVGAVATTVRELRATGRAGERAPPWARRLGGLLLVAGVLLVLPRIEDRIEDLLVEERFALYEDRSRIQLRAQTVPEGVEALRPHAIRRIELTGSRDDAGLAVDEHGERWSFDPRRPRAPARRVALPDPPATASAAGRAAVGLGCAARADGEVECWVTRGEERTSTVVDGVRGAVFLATSHDRACAIDRDGRLFCWERPTGWPPPSRLELRARQYLEGTPVKHVSVGPEHACAAAASGKVSCWGANRWGQLGDGSTEDHVEPVEVRGIEDAVEVAAGASATCAVRAGGAVSCWGVRRRFP